MSVSAFPTQTPLNLIMPVKAGSTIALRALLAGLVTSPDRPVERALTALGNVHHAQFVLLDTDTRLGVFTWYDGSFDDYILSFVEHIGSIFNAILQHVEGADGLLPVEMHRNEFLAFIDAHHCRPLHTFSAYPARRMFDIKDALGI